MHPRPVITLKNGKLLMFIKEAIIVYLILSFCLNEWKSLCVSVELNAKDLFRHGLCCNDRPSCLPTPVMNSQYDVVFVQYVIVITTF